MYTEYLLMHKNIPVAQMNIDETGDMKGIKKNNEYRDHLPLGCKLNDMKFHEWWKDRAVPKTRDGASAALKSLGFNSTNSMLINNLALSLNDCYWIKPVQSDIRWEHVSLFRNNFIDIFGALTFDSSANFAEKSRYATSQGELQKKWCIATDGRRFLVKGNWGSSYQQSLNEVLASEIHKMQNKFPYTQYGLTSIDVKGGEKGIGCYSYNFCSEDVEFISAWEVLQLEKIKQNESWYDKLCNICVNRLGMDRTYVENFLGYEIMTDFILSNTDRHMNNIGILRNPDTLEYYGFAPIYDSGNSMFFRSQTIGKNLLDVNTCSFVKKEVNLLKYVKDRDLVDISKLPEAEFLNKLYLKDVVERHSRIENLLLAYEAKIRYLDQFQNGVDIWKPSKYRR